MYGSLASAHNGRRYVITAHAQTTFPVDSLHTVNLRKIKISSHKISAKKTIVRNRSYKYQ